MTTPAVNINTDTGTQTASLVQLDCNGNPIGAPVLTTVSEQRLFDGRPASVNNPKTASGWRNPSSWNRHKVVCTTIPRSHTKTLTSSSCPSGKMRGWEGFNKVSCPFNQVHNLDVPAWIKDVATTRAYVQLKNSDANLGVMFAERKETSDLLEHAMKRVAQQVREFRSKYTKKFYTAKAVEGSISLRNWKLIPDLWLELQYGWNPLMSDVQGACKALSKKERDAKAYTAHVVGTCKTSTTDILTGSCTFVNAGAFTATWPRTCNASAKCSLYYNLDSPLLATFSSLGLTNPAEIVWERLKYSFVVDWFLPVSSWLSTLDADFGWKYKSGTMSTFARTRGQYTFKGNTGVAGWDSSGDFGNASFNGFIFNRGVLAAPPGVGLPHFKNPFSAKHIANALSLLVQAFK